MKTIIKALSMALLAAGFAACEGVGGEDGPIATGKYELYVDKAEIEADGKDAATVTLQDPDGKILTVGNSLQYLKITIENTGETLKEGENKFTSIENGTFTLKVKYKGKYIDGTVTVTAKNRGKYEKYFRKVVVYDVTNTGCAPCAIIASAFENLETKWKNHLLLMAVHGNFYMGQDDPWMMASVGESLFRQFGLSGFPSVIYNLDKAQTGSRTSAQIAETIREQLLAYPATCGLALESSYREEGDAGHITIKAKIESSTGGTYDVGYALLLDGQKFDGGTIASGIYNDIVIALSGNFSQMSTSKFDLQADGSKDTEISFPLVNSKDGSAMKLTAEQQENCRVVAFALNDKSGKVIMDNAAVAKLGTKQDIILNE